MHSINKRRKWRAQLKDGKIFPKVSLFNATLATLAQTRHDVYKICCGGAPSYSHTFARLRQSEFTQNERFFLFFKDGGLCSEVNEHNINTFNTHSHRFVFLFIEMVDVLVQLLRLLRSKTNFSDIQ